MHTHKKRFRKSWHAKQASQKAPGSTQATLFDSLELPQRTLPGEPASGQSEPIRLLTFGPPGGPQVVVHATEVERFLKPTN